MVSNSDAAKPDKKKIAASIHCRDCMFLLLFSDRVSRSFMRATHHGPVYKGRHHWRKLMRGLR